MSRSVWKIPYISNLYISNFIKDARKFKIWMRNSIIPANFVGNTIKIHNGIWLLSLNIKSAVVGHKFGEFSFSKRLGREIHFHNKSKKKN